MDSRLLNDIIYAAGDKCDHKITHDSRLVEPTFGSKYYYPGDEFHQIRCGPELHLAIHDTGRDTNTRCSLITDWEKVNEKDEFGNNALHIVAIVAYNTGTYKKMKEYILLLQSVGIKQQSVNNEGETAADLFDRMIKKASDDADDPWAKSYDIRMFNSHAYELTKLRDMLYIK